jgi:hypothetical protein
MRRGVKVRRGELKVMISVFPFGSIPELPSNLDNVAMLKLLLNSKSHRILLIAGCFCTVSFVSFGANESVSTELFVNRAEGHDSATGTSHTHSSHSRQPLRACRTPRRLPQQHRSHEWLDVCWSIQERCPWTDRNDQRNHQHRGSHRKIIGPVSVTRGGIVALPDRTVVSGK